MKKIKLSYYHRYKRGDLHLVDLLTVDFENKTVTDTFEYECEKGFPFNEIKISGNGYQSKIKKLVKKGYSYRKVDGQKYRMSEKEVNDALSLQFPKEKLIEMTRNKPVIADFYDSKKVIHALCAVERKEISLFYFEHFALLYSLALQENFKKENRKLDNISYLVVKLLSDLVIDLKKTNSKEELEKEIHDALVALNLIDNKRNKILKKKIKEEKSNA